MPTQCNQDSFAFASVEGRRVEAAFDGGTITSDAGALLLGATDRAIRLIDRFAAGFHDARRPELWFASMAYVLMCALRRIGLAHTEFAHATCGSIRLKLLKIGALVRVSVRRVKIAMASAHPCQHVFALAHARLCIAASSDLIRG